MSRPGVGRCLACHVVRSAVWHVHLVRTKMDDRKDGRLYIAALVSVGLGGGLVYLGG